MTRYILFTVFGSILAFSIIVTSPKYSLIFNAVGLIILSIGAGLYLTNIKLAGFLSMIGIVMFSHVIYGWWYNFFIFEFDEIQNKVLPIYILSTIITCILLILAFLSATNGKKINNKIDNISNNIFLAKILTLMPIMIVLIVVSVSLFFYR